MTRTKFTTAVKDRILEAAKIGASQETAAYVAGIDPATLSRWLAKGREQLSKASDLDNLPAFAQFATDFHSAQVAPNIKALAVINREMENDAKLAWKFVERREKGYQPPIPQAPDRPQVQILQLSLATGAPVNALEAATVIEVEEPDGATGGAAGAEDPAEAPTVVTLAERGSE